MLILLISIYMHAIINAQNINLIDVNKFTNSWPRNNEYSAKNIYAYLDGYSYFTADDGLHGRELWKTNGTAAGTQLVKDVNPGTPSSDYDYSAYDIKASGGKLYFAADGGIGHQGLWVSNGTAAGTKFVADVTGQGVLPAYLTDVNGTLFFATSYYDYYYTFQYINQIWKTDGTAAGTTLVADLGPYGYRLEQLKNVNGRLFFTFYNFDGTGDELYTSDGTSGGTYMVADINSFGDSNPLQLTASNGLLYFIADEGYGGKLFVSDGTAAGTHAVNNNGITCYATSDAYNTDTFAIVNNVLFLQGSTFDNGNELCKYNKSNPAAGITMVKDIEPGANSSYPSFMTNVNGILFFTVGPAGKDAELWKSNGTKAGTKLVKDINPGGNNFYYGLTNLNGELVFAYGDNASGYDLWKSNGTSASTNIVKDINPGIYSSFPQYLTVSNGLLLFGANNGINGYELWKSNGTTAGTTLLKDINTTSTASSYPYSFTAGPANTVLFGASDQQRGTELWRTNGTAAGTDLVKDINKGVFDGAPNYFINFKNKVYFFANDSSGYRLWTTNGTGIGTKVIPAAWDNVNASIITMLAGNDLFYVIDYNNNTGEEEVWRSDGTTEGTYLVKPDIPPFYSTNAVVVGNVLYFTSDDFFGLYGDELYKSEGTVASTGIVKDIFPGSNGSFPSQLFNFNGKIYFTAYDAQAPYGYVLWTSDGTEAGTKIVKPVLVNNVPFAQANGKLFFSGEDAVSKGYELYATNGTAIGTRIVKNIAKGANSSGIYYLTSGNKLVYFTADDGIHGNEVWRSDGTSIGTFMLKNIVAGNNGTYPYYLVNANDNLYFVDNDTLWQSDGTKAGTKKINDNMLNGVTGINNLAYVNGHLYFSGYTYATGSELYVADVSGNSAPEQMVKSIAQINPGKNFEAKLFNNPFNDQLKFTVNIKDQQAAQVMISDASGRIISSEQKMLSPGTNSFSYNSNTWIAGMYLIKITAADGSASILKAVK